MIGFFISICKGACLGGIICIISYIADNTVSHNSLKILLDKSSNLYKESKYAIGLNMLVLSPITYAIVDSTIIDHTINPHTIDIGKIMCILLIQSIGYYVVHASFHKTPRLYTYHKFHHKFDSVLVPSIGNAVSWQEYCMAYMLPFVCGAIITKPNEISFIIPIGIVALLNMTIHCQELKSYEYNKYLVSPQQHIEHHIVRDKHFAAPLFNIDNLVTLLKK